MIQEHVKTPLAEEVLFGRLAKGGTVLVDVQDDKPVFSYPDTGPAKKKGRDTSDKTPEPVS
jgi:ATP-dependent Clp protease ATP-binding subunit ClpA